MAKQEKYFQVTLALGVPGASSAREAAEIFFRSIEHNDDLNAVTVLEGTTSRSGFKAHGKPKKIKVDRQQLRNAIPTEEGATPITEFAKRGVRKLTA